MTAPSADPALDGLHAFTPSPTAVADPSPLPHARTGSGGSSEDGGRAATPAAATAASSRNGSSLQDPSSSQHAQPPPPPPPPPGGRLHAHHKRSHFKVRDVAEITYDVGTQGCPPPSAGHTAAWHDRRLFVFGGADGDRMHADVWLLQESNLRWRRVRSSGPAPLARQHHAAAVCGRKLLVYGGFGLGGATVSRQQKPEDSPAQQLLQLSYTRASEPMRWAEHTDGYQLLKCGLLRSVHALDLTTYQWSELSAEGEAIREHSMVCHKNRLYVFGGTMLGGRTNHVRCFDCETLRWLPEKHYNKQLHDAAKDESVMSSPVPTVRSGHAACLHRHEMVVFGGRLSKRAYSAELFAYDLRTRLWRQITPVNESQEPSGMREDTPPTHHMTIHALSARIHSPSPRIFLYLFLSQAAAGTPPHNKADTSSSTAARRTLRTTTKRCTSRTATSSSCPPACGAPSTSRRSRTTGSSHAPSTPRLPSSPPPAASSSSSSVVSFTPPPAPAPAPAAPPQAAAAAAAAALRPPPRNT